MKRAAKEVTDLDPEGPLMGLQPQWLGKENLRLFDKGSADWQRGWAFCRGTRKITFALRILSSTSVHFGKGDSTSGQEKGGCWRDTCILSPYEN